MPVRKHPVTAGGSTRKRLGVAAAVAVAAFMAPAAASAATAASCPVVPTTQAFAKWGDKAQYSMAPGGNFESGTAGWTFTGGAKIVSGNTTTAVSGAGAKSLLIPGGGTATSPEFCVGNEHPYFRYMIKANQLSLFKTVVEYKDAKSSSAGISLLSSLKWLDSPSWLQQNLSANVWNAGALNPLSLTIPLSATGTATARLKFSVAAGSYSIDDVMIDPYRRG